MDEPDGGGTQGRGAGDAGGADGEDPLRVMGAAVMALGKDMVYLVDVPSLRLSRPTRSARSSTRLPDSQMASFP